MKPKSLHKKLGSESTQKVFLYHALINYFGQFEYNSEQINSLELDDTTGLDFVHTFIINNAELKRYNHYLKALINKNVMLWVS